MCFTRRGEMQKATKNILVYKGLDVGDRGGLRSPYYPIPWRAKIKKKARGFLKNAPWTSLNEGFHSCKDKNTANGHSSTVFEFIIPKGALYYENQFEYL